MTSSIESDESSLPRPLVGGLALGAKGKSLEVIRMVLRDIVKGGKIHGINVDEIHSATILGLERALVVSGGELPARGVIRVSNLRRDIGAVI